MSRTAPAGCCVILFTGIAAGYCSPLNPATQISFFWRHREASRTRAIIRFIHATSASGATGKR